MKCCKIPSSSNVLYSYDSNWTFSDIQTLPSVCGVVGVETAIAIWSLVHTHMRTHTHKHMRVHTSTHTHTPLLSYYLLTLMVLIILTLRSFFCVYPHSNPISSLLFLALQIPSMLILLIWALALFTYPDNAHSSAPGYIPPLPTEFTPVFLLNPFTTPSPSQEKAMGKKWKSVKSV